MGTGWVLHLGVLISPISLNFLESLLPQEHADRAGWMWASSSRDREVELAEWAAQAERWVARAKKTAVTIHLLGLVLCLSKLVAMLHVHLWNFNAHISREGTQNRLLCRSASLQGRGLHVSFLLGGCFFPLSSYLFLFKSRHVLHPCVHPCPPSLLYKPPLNLPAGCFVSVCAGLLLHLSVCAGLLLQAELLAGSHEAECTGQKLSEGFWVPHSLSGRPKALELDGGSLLFLGTCLPQPGLGSDVSKLRGFPMH